MEVGKSLIRVDALDKVKGTARYTDDLCPKPCLCAQVVHATIANGLVTEIDTSAAEHIPGIVAIFTFSDVPDHQFPTPGHPWSVEEAHQDIADRKLLDSRIRIYGDDIAVVVAEDSVSATRAVRAIKVQYEEYEPMVTVKQALSQNATVLHPDISESNELVHMDLETPLLNNRYSSVDDAINDKKLNYIKIHTETQQVNQCHIEPNISYAYMEGDRIVVVSSTQIPHIVRRVCGQALDIPWGRIRVIKPYIGGGFGNKQEVLYEPLNAWLTYKLGGRCVKLELSREEVFQNTRSRHPMSFDVECSYDNEMNIIARRIEGYSNQGGYASHGHALIANAVNAFRWAYFDKVGCRTIASTVYSNIPTPGAMRAYGVPQGEFTAECLIDDIAYREGWDPIELRLNNLMPLGYKDPFNGITCYSSGYRECIERGRDYIGWYKHKKQYAAETGLYRHGIGMACFVYKTGVYPISLESSSARLVLNDDGTCQLHLGATEIGQGADTVMCQMAAETIGFPSSAVHIVSFQDTDVAPFDTGAYASRQTYVAGHAVRKVATIFRQRILDYAKEMFPEAEGLDIQNGLIIDAEQETVIDMESLAQEAFYSLNHSVHITSEATFQVKNNTLAFGASYVKIEVDMPLGKVKITDIVNVHDSGKIINPALARGQVYGGMAQGIGAALYEEMLIDPKTGRLQNGNLLDYKIPTSLDIPEMHSIFVETNDPSGPYGNKALGEPPLLAPVPAIRNAILDATGVAFYELPMTPQRLFERFKEEGLI